MDGIFQDQRYEWWSGSRNRSDSRATWSTVLGLGTLPEMFAAV